jgi:hypothetical protein
MTRTENDLRAVLHDLERRADEHGAPPVGDLVAYPHGGVLQARPDPSSTPRRLPRWVPPAAAVAAVAATAITVVTIGNWSGGSNRGTPAGGHLAPNAGSGAVVPRLTASATHGGAARPQSASAAAILGDAADRLDAATGWTAPAPSDFFYVRTNGATTWTSVSGRQAGEGKRADGMPIWVSGCRHGQIVSDGESGSCTLDQVPHYLADAPTTAGAWDAYLERIAPGAKAAAAQGKIIVQVLHQDLVAPKAAAALVRYTMTCPGLHTVAVQSVGGRALVGVTCTSMINGSYALAFDATSHAFVGFAGLGANGEQEGPTEVIEQTGIVHTVGRTP